MRGTAMRLTLSAQLPFSLSADTTRRAFPMPEQLAATGATVLCSTARLGVAGPARYNILS